MDFTKLKFEDLCHIDDLVSRIKDLNVVDEYRALLFQLKSVENRITICQAQVDTLQAHIILLKKLIQSIEECEAKMPLDAVQKQNAMETLKNKEEEQLRCKTERDNLKLQFSTKKLEFMAECKNFVTTLQDIN